MSGIRIIFYAAAFQLLIMNYVLCQFSVNTPPILMLERRWMIPETEEVGSVVTRVRAEDNEGDQLEFGLEPKGYPSSESGPLPFRIDNGTGVVYLNESLKDRGDQNILLYVTVSDGQLTAKTEVWVNIVSSTKQTSSLRPQLHPNPGRLRPPFLSLPGFNSRPPLPPPYSTNPESQPSPPDLSMNHQPGETFPKQQKTYPDHLAPSPKSTILLPTNSSNSMYTTTMATSSSSEEESDEISNEVDVPKQEHNVTLPPAPTDLPIRSHPDLVSTLIPVASVCAIFLIAGVIAIVFRKKICPTKSKGNKDDMSKEPSGGIILQEDPSVAMQHWRGPRAYNNRYEPWDREAVHPQAERQGSNSSTSKPPAGVGDLWEFPRHRLKVFNILGEGAFGQVWRCEALDIDGKEGVSTVAVKTLKENATEKERSDLTSELQVMKMLEPHPNVVRLLGCCTEKEPIFVIMEYVNHGKLQSYLRSSRAERHYGNMHGQSKTLTSRDLTSFVYQVAKGMEFLSSKGIIHRDLAARNVLITDDHTCKVADFGFARDVIASHVYERKSEGRLPIRWMAPESLYDNIFSVKSDVWSFGILMWEVVTLGSTPYPGLSAADVMRKVRDGHRLDKPEHCRRELYNIMYYCWDQSPKERPGFQECVGLLEKLLLTETDYIELERFPDHSYYNMLSLSGEKL